MLQFDFYVHSAVAIFIQQYAVENHDCEAPTLLCCFKFVIKN